MKRPSRLPVVTVVASLVLSAIAVAAGQSPPGNPPRSGISGGMGVSAVHAPDLAEFVTAVTLERPAEYRTAVEFFGSVRVPVVAEWLLKLEYAYLLGSYDAGGGAGRGEFTFTAHLPTLIVQYAVAEEPLYSFRVGAGAGYHVGVLTARYSTLDDRFTGSGPGFKMEIEGNTSLGEDLFAFLGVDARWDFIGDIRNGAGFGPPLAPGTDPPTLSFISVGAKLGVSWLF